MTTAIGPSLATALLVLALMAGADRVAPAETVSDEEVDAIARELRCVVCQNLSVADSPSEMAHQMRSCTRRYRLRDSKGKDLREGSLASPLCSLQAPS